MYTFDGLSMCLNQLMTEDYIAVNKQKNPIVRFLYQASFSQLVYVIRQYSIFPKELVAFAQIARQKAFEANWLDVDRELQENIAEEMGSSTDGISHYDLLAEGLEAGLALPIKTTQPSFATRHLLESLDAIGRQGAVYVFGAMYAIEATSIAELTIVMQVIEHVLDGEMPQPLRYFFDMHLNEWEPEHEEDLRKTLAQYIEQAEFHQFKAGFCAVMAAMDLWWTELALEANLPIEALELVTA